MRFVLFFFSLRLFAVDFDCILIGSSPFSLFEALYQASCGKKVAVFEERSSCGGAWKAIDICGVPNVDLGCHQVGHDPSLKSFLETYAGCKIVSLDNPENPFEPGPKSGNGFYFAGGCYELVSHLVEMLDAAGVFLYLNHKVESVSVDPIGKTVSVQTRSGLFSASKLIATPMSSLLFPQSDRDQNYSPSYHYHIYLLIQDSARPRFSYRGGLGQGTSRFMNLTHFSEVGEGLQLIAIQTNGKQHLENGEKYFELLKIQGLLSENALLLRQEPCIYESGKFNQAIISQIKGNGLIEILQTGAFSSMNNYIHKWKEALRPYAEIFP